MISIHAPANGATKWCYPVRVSVDYFNPRSGERSDLPFSISPPILIEFQSTLRRTERPGVRCGSHIHKFQSTLRRTERLFLGDILHLLSNFNPRSGERSDLFKMGKGKQRVYFNPRSGERSDSSDHTGRPSYLYFNPRSDERSDAGDHCHIKGFTNFNPRSDERSDSCLFVASLITYISIHAPTNGATRLR